MSDIESRVLARVVKIDSVRMHPNADRLDLCMVGGWQVVAARGEYAPGDLAVYCEIDSWIPTRVAPFLTKGREPRVYDGVSGERLRTVTLRGELSQGLLLPLSVLSISTDSGIYLGVWEEGWDVTGRLGITKWERPVPAQLAGEIKGYLPTDTIRKTDQERIQNLHARYAEWIADPVMRTGWEESEKLEGASMSVYYDGRRPADVKFGVCSRNLDLRESPTNTLWKVARKQHILEMLEQYYKDTGQSLAVQGELVGPQIEGNIYGLKDHCYYVYTVWSIDQQRELPPETARRIAEVLGQPYVPVTNPCFTLPDSPSDLLVRATGMTTLASSRTDTLREGFVYKHPSGRSFKAVSNEYLMKG